MDIAEGFDLDDWCNKCEKNIYRPEVIPKEGKST